MFVICATIGPRGNAVQFQFRSVFHVAYFGVLLTNLTFAQAVLNKGVQSDPLEQRFRAAQTFQVSGDFDKAASEYRRAIADALDRVGNIRVAEGNYGEGVELLERALQSFPDYVDARVDIATSITQKIWQRQSLRKPRICAL